MLKLYCKDKFCIRGDIMKVESVSNQGAFKATVSSKFAKNAERYYQKKFLPIQSDSFRRKIEQLEYYGSKDSVIMYTCQQNQNQRQHMLYLKNETINAKQGVILKVSDKYNEILRYFQSLTAEIIEDAEDILAQK